MLLQIAVANVLIAAVNMLPAYPLDAGQLLRAALWKLTKDEERATRLSAWAAQAIGFTLILLGVLIAFAGALGRWVAIWSAFLGWFLASGAARAYERMERVNEPRAVSAN